MADLPEKNPTKPIEWFTLFFVVVGGISSGVAWWLTDRDVGKSQVILNEGNSSLVGLRRELFEIQSTLNRESTENYELQNRKLEIELASIENRDRTLLAKEYREAVATIAPRVKITHVPDRSKIFGGVNRLAWDIENQGNTAIEVTFVELMIAPKQAFTISRSTQVRGSRLYAKMSSISIPKTDVSWSGSSLANSRDPTILPVVSVPTVSQIGAGEVIKFEVQYAVDDVEQGAPHYWRAFFGLRTSPSYLARYLAIWNPDQALQNGLKLSSTKILVETGRVKYSGDLSTLVSTKEFAQFHSLSPSQHPTYVSMAQNLLNRLGYDTGPSDGLLGPSTHAALRKYQEDLKLEVTGTLDIRTFTSLYNYKRVKN